MGINHIASGIHAAKGLAVIQIGFRLAKKPHKTQQEMLAAKSFLHFFWSTLALVLALTIGLAMLIGYAMDSKSLRYGGAYAESRTGRIQNGQVRYVKDELYYVAPEVIGLPGALPEGTHINVYFDENGDVVAGENADVINSEIQSRVILALGFMAGMAVFLIVFAMVAGKTFGKPWFLWLQEIRESQGN